MDEHISDLPKKHPRRSAVARQIAGARKTDQRLHRSEYRDGSTRNRSGEHYENSLNGLRGFFEHVRALQSTTVIDVGAGTTRGVADLSDSSIAREIDFHATVLSHDDRIEENLGADKTHHTSVESLRGFGTGTVGGIIGAFSIAYSADPALAVAGVDRVLVPGGVVKSRFRAKDALENINLGFKHANLFIQEFRKRGYDVATDEREQVLVAVKSGISSAGEHIAQKILSEDAAGLQVDTAAHVKWILS